jgi:ElaB/YqjD/DUF883 family membrane-anchored ribosome-binding protein
MLQSKLEDVSAQRDQFHSELAASNTRYDRLKSRTVQAMSEHKAQGNQDANAGQVKEDKDAVVKMEEVARESPSQSVSGRMLCCKRRGF